jgi:hypothetical protein
MKDQRNKPTTAKSQESSGKSLDALYLELLDLRQEVKQAEQRSPQNTRKKLSSKADPDA